MLNMRIGWDLFMKIENIKLFTSEFEETFQFYEEILECPVRMISQEAFTVEIERLICVFNKQTMMSNHFTTLQLIFHTTIL